MVVITLTLTTVAAAIGAVGGIVAIGSTAIDKIKGFLPDKEADKLEVKYLRFNDKRPKGGFRLILVNEKTGWNKAVRIYLDPKSSDYKEIKAGDSTGKPCKKNMHLKYDSTRIDFPKDVEYISLNLMKPGALGVYSTVDEIRIYKDIQSKLDGKTLVIYWDNDDSKYFDKKENLVSPADIL
ncbi:hypothetical protein DDB_G0290885 [Dictyostelium discoideum AX4]|uniref:Uncharacterized protein n=1 Tax=Dictyostelium discoideum TaxID=44689 RepID=Q54FF8_DICDI|nr:hypothetical protein DDB_G0290885 [Dictyostelium discoideum AX4]EAL62007.1 hypothetical protein DDB_G0290885 [Dictyostelium discoideum AX4]|eukprot:XP_635513.1 hypothetical protein DDB_G0290885 [Dictyostelium discoideum AX4]